MKMCKRLWGTCACARVIGGWVAVFLAVILAVGVLSASAEETAKPAAAPASDPAVRAKEIEAEVAQIRAARQKDMQAAYELDMKLQARKAQVVQENAACGQLALQIEDLRKTLGQLEADLETRLTADAEYARLAKERGAAMESWTRGEARERELLRARESLKAGGAASGSNLGPEQEKK